MKKILMTSFALAVFFAANAQQKKLTTKPAAKSTTTQTAAKTPATGGINENNYGTVVEYLNDIVDCLNKQQPEINNREEYKETWSNYYVNNKPNSKNKVVYSPYIAYDLTKNSAGCTNGPAPAIMGPTDVNFYNENYKALRDTFNKMAMVWNDLSKYSKSTPPTDEYGKQKCQELISLTDSYYQTRKKLSDRSKQLQKQLFSYSVAKSPYKTSYVNMHDDLTDIQDFAGSFKGYDDIMNNRDSLMTALTQLEGRVTEHTLYATENKTPTNYKNYYETLNNYISRTKALLNSKGMSAKQKDDVIYSYTYALKAIVPAYNTAIQ